MIKTVKPSGQYISSSYIPQNKEKYKGTYPILCRSSWERKFCIYLDMNPKVIKWSSEAIEIPYYNYADKRTHRYYPDYLFTVSGVRENEMQQYLAEVKPAQFLSKPLKPKSSNINSMIKYNEKLKNFLTIMSKREAAKKWAQLNNAKYIFVTEEFLKKIGV